MQQVDPPGYNHETSFPQFHKQTLKDFLTGYVAYIYRNCCYQALHLIPNHKVWALNWLTYSPIPGETHLISVKGVYLAFVIYSYSINTV